MHNERLPVSCIVGNLFSGQFISNRCTVYWKLSLKLCPYWTFTCCTSLWNSQLGVYGHRRVWLNFLDPSYLPAPIAALTSVEMGMTNQSCCCDNWCVLVQHCAYEMTAVLTKKQHVTLEMETDRLRVVYTATSPHKAVSYLTLDS